jgi:hypothetical protein
MKRTPVLSALLLSIVCPAMTCRKDRGDIVSASTSVVGIDISQDAASSTPHIRLGYVRTQFHIVPTARGSNGISAPQVSNTMGVDSAPLHNKINESFSTGEATTSTGDAPALPSLLNNR